MSKLNNSQFLDMILAFGKYEDCKKACDSYNACHYPKITPHRIKMAIKYLSEHGQFQPPLTSRNNQGKINKLAQDKAKPVPLKPSSRISDSKRKGKTVTGATKSSSQQVSSQEKSPQQGSSQEKSPQQVSSQEKSPHQVSSQEKSPQQVSSQEKSPHSYLEFFALQIHKLQTELSIWEYVREILTEPFDKNYFDCITITRKLSILSRVNVIRAAQSQQQSVVYYCDQQFVI